MHYETTSNYGLLALLFWQVPQDEEAGRRESTLPTTRSTSGPSKADTGEGSVDLLGFDSRSVGSGEVELGWKGLLNERGDMESLGREASEMSAVSRQESGGMMSRPLLEDVELGEAEEVGPGRILTPLPSLPLPSDGLRARSRAGYPEPSGHRRSADDGSRSVRLFNSICLTLTVQSEQIGTFRLPIVDIV